MNVVTPCQESFGSSGRGCYSCWSSLDLFNIRLHRPFLGAGKIPFGGALCEVVKVRSSILRAALKCLLQSPAQGPDSINGRGAPAKPQPLEIQNPSASRQVGGVTAGSDGGGSVHTWVPHLPLGEAALDHPPRVESRACPWWRSCVPPPDVARPAGTWEAQTTLNGHFPFMAAAMRLARENMRASFRICNTHPLRAISFPLILLSFAVVDSFPLVTIFTYVSPALDA